MTAGQYAFLCFLIAGGFTWVALRLEHILSYRDTLRRIELMLSSVDKSVHKSEGENEQGD